MPMEVTVKLLENAMADALKEGRAGTGWAEGKGRFLVDGFPRKMDQAIKFEEDVSCFCVPLTANGRLNAGVLQVCRSALTLFFTTTEQVMLDRLLERGKTSGRDDDNAESIVKRFRASPSPIWISGTLPANVLCRDLQGDDDACHRVLQQGGQGCGSEPFPTHGLLEDAADHFGRSMRPPQWKKSTQKPRLSYRSCLRMRLRGTSRSEAPRVHNVTGRPTDVFSCETRTKYT